MKNIFLALTNEIFNLKCVFLKLRTEVVPAFIQNGKKWEATRIIAVWPLPLRQFGVSSPAQKCPFSSS